ncbi:MULTISPECIES: 30S ribosomal protein S13 [Methanogenium]|jgi:small subunit ribosomal protein S13|uniref:30S ribosomal protein S13 n=1 Tax=Methanogenium TaxID=2195 RepID=UPI000785E7A9|nr:MULTISPECIES: 30S ribosomal protein S13 [Methanogenium]KAF1077983.1 30S ribosomal protein S13 [Methanogenium sp. MK-MG]
MEEQEINYFVRIENTDLDGTKAVQIALTGLAGIGMHTSSVISKLADVDPRATLGLLDEEPVDRIRAVVTSYKDHVPTWMLNRQKDVYTGEAKQLLGQDLRMAIEDDVNRMRKIRSYRGIRHETGQKVRGQRTKSTGRTGTTVGVRRKKV